MISLNSKLTTSAQTVIGLLVITALTCLLYIPFLGNRLVFDDHHFFTSFDIYNYATTPLNLTPRNFPYFTLGFVEVMWKDIVIHRSISLALHLLNTVILFRLLDKWLTEIGELTPEKACALSCLGCVFFSLHPVTVYGAGYLAQRTILFATLFSLLSIWFFWRGLSKNRITDIITAALFYACAIYSKEHAIMLPASAILLAAITKKEWHTNIVKIILFLILCIPPAFYVVLAVKGTIGTAYEVDSANFINGGIPNSVPPGTEWKFSVITQMGLFYQYFEYWLLPDISKMSADIRVDFLSHWTPLWIGIKLTCFLGAGLGGLLLLIRKGKSGLAGWGILYFWLLFATELVSVRFQEPFVLYRSYLWAPGIILFLLCIIARFNSSNKTILAGTALISCLFIPMSRDRLHSLENDAALWNDAVQKLSAQTLAGAERIYYNIGLQDLLLGQFQEALGNMNKVISLIPNSPQGYIGRAKIYQKIHQHQLALNDLELAKNNIKSTETRTLGEIEYHSFISLIALHLDKEAEIEIQKSMNHGNLFATMVINSRKNTVK